MSNNSAELLENIISAGINTLYKDVPPTEKEFVEKAEELRSANKAIAPVTDTEFQSLLSRLRKNIVVQMDVGVYIEDQNNGHQSWLPAKRADYDFFFWNRYKRYLEEIKHWNPRMTRSLGIVSDEILDLCGDPSEDHFAVKGLILGDVQSGKTANYTAICNKAADVGYRIIIILAGMQENLRRQTQERLDMECTGRQSKDYLDPKVEQRIKNNPVGVGRYGSDKKIVAFTSIEKDFDSGVLRSNNLGIENVNCPVILVVKKNKRILNNLIQWLSDNNTYNGNGQIDLPLMLIDDEADNASPNTKDRDSDPTAINDCIRRLLKLFSKSSYIGITATPFANIFIDPGNDEDLFPSDFIYALSPPDDYIGADRIFGDGGDYSSVLQSIDLYELERCFPAKHKKDFIVQELPSDLYDAAYYFLLTNAIRDYRGDNTEHRSMMVHISLYTNVQKQIADIIGEWLEQVKSDLRNYSQLSSDKTEKITNISNLHKVWYKYKLVEDVGIEWNNLLRNYLYKAVAPIDVKPVNMKTGADSLNYQRYKDNGMRVIAVGGNSLSRGLTLEGLCVTYFHRNTKMYDTLMQMGRWFGYRPNYDDIVKVWMSQEAIDWYGQITRATADLKEQIFEMKSLGQTPREFGLKVRQDPGALIVTARNKMRTATQISCPITVSGHLLETPRLKTSLKVLKENEILFKNFVCSLANSGKFLTDEERSGGNYYWEHVPSDVVANLLLNFNSHPWHLSYNGHALSQYVSENDWPTGWDVVLINKGEGDAYPEALRYGAGVLAIKRTERRKITADQEMASISGTKVRVGSGGCTRIGLTREQISAVQDKFRHETGKHNVPDSAYLIENRAPILMLHIIQADYTESQNKDLPPYLFALGVGFPKRYEGNRSAQYQVNLVELRNWIDADDFPPEEDEQ